MKKLLCLLFILSMTATPIYAAPEALTRGQTRDMIFAAASKYNDGLQATDIMMGYEDGSLKENQSATRLEMLLMLSRAFGAFPTPKGDNLRRAAGVSEYTDAPSWAKSAIDNLNGGLLLVPSEDKSLKPSEAATEKELDVYLRRIWALYGTRLEDDFYAYVNKDWLDTAEMPENTNLIGAMYDILNKSTAQVDEILDEILSGKWEKGTPQRKVVDYYNACVDKTSQNKTGAAPIKPYLDRLSAVKNISDLNAALSVLASDTAYFPYIRFRVDRDHKDSARNRVYLQSGYSVDMPESFAETVGKAFRAANVSQPEKATDLAVNIQSRLTAANKDLPDRFSFTDEEIKLKHRLISAADMKTLVSAADTDAILSAIGLKPEAEYYVLDIEELELKELSKLYTDDNAPALAALAQYKLIDEYKRYMGELFSEPDEPVQTSEEIIKEARKDIKGTLSGYLGDIYAERFASEATKAEVKNMVKEFIEVYKTNVESLDWMSQATKNMAIKKLDMMMAQIAYPDKRDDFIDGLDVSDINDGGSHLYNQIAVWRRRIQQRVQNRDKALSESDWGFPIYTTNAAVVREQNGISVFAGILMSPLYNKDASIEENLAGIGWVIAHEITHNFDQVGAQYDEKGGLSDWWTNDDKLKFNELCKNVSDFYADAEYAVGLTQTKGGTEEDVADLGSLACALAALKKMKPNADYQLFFKHAALVWRTSSTRKHYEMSKSGDNHSVGSNRVNMVFKTLPEFYEAFNIKPGDGMYIAPEQRVKIW